jgi:hypothetical protein
VVILNARGDTLPRTSVTWTSDAPLIGSVTTAGLVVARDTGQTMVRAKYGIAPGDTIRDSMDIRIFNLPASIVLSDSRDTMTAIGQALAYTGLVRNARGNEIPGYPLSWSSTNPAAVTVSTSGVATAAGYGSAFVIGHAGGVADTVVDVVVNPTRLIVDNATATSLRFGTRERPYARIQEGLTAAEVDDTVFVRKGAGSYSETVALTRRSHCSETTRRSPPVRRESAAAAPHLARYGVAGITAYTASTVVIKNLALRHTTAGPPSMPPGGPSRRRVYVNPPGTVTARIGRGISLDSASSVSATITSTDIRSVRGFGIRVREGQGVAIDSVYIESVDSLPGSMWSRHPHCARQRQHRASRQIRGTQGRPFSWTRRPARSWRPTMSPAGNASSWCVPARRPRFSQSLRFPTAGTQRRVYSGGTLLEWAALQLDSSWQAIVASNTFRDVARTDQEPFNAMRFVAVEIRRSPRSRVPRC